MENHYDELSNGRGNAVTQNSSQRRKTRSNACHRFKSKKLRCHYIGQNQAKCRQCEKADVDCIFNVTPDSVPRGAAYIASLEAQVASLKEELNRVYSAPTDNPLAHQSNNDSSLHRDGSNADAPPDDNARIPRGSVHYSARPVSAQMRSSDCGNIAFGFSEMRERNEISPNCHSLRFPRAGNSDASSDITPFNMLQAAPSPSGVETLRTLPDLPPEQIASRLIEAAYLYTQARYCIVDWVQIREWHRRREQICYAGPNDDLESQIGAYFIWIVYAIGARFSVHHEHASTSYFSRARNYLPAVLSLQNLTTLQALLALTQYSFRASGGPSVWHLVGICLRLCIELGYHRSVGVHRDPKSAYKTELQKRFFWCAYSFDRMISYISKRPFGIADTDIDVEVPLDIDLTCTDNDTIHTLQSSLSPSSDASISGGPTTEMSSVLHQLRLDRLRSRIMTRFMATGAPPPSSEEVWGLLAELSAWRLQVPRELPAPFPQHSNDRVHATQLYVALLLLRPVLAQESMDQDLLLRCAMLSADACENARTLSLSPQQQASPIQVYHCFNCGVSLLQCLALQPTVLAPRRTVRAIVACSSALAIYSKSLATASIFLDLFEKLAEGFLGVDENEDPPKHPDLPLRSVLQEIIASAPAEMPRILRSLSNMRRGDTMQGIWLNNASTQELPHEYIPHHLDFASIGSNIFPNFDASDLTEPFEMFYDMAHLYDSQMPSDN